MPSLRHELICTHIWSRNENENPGMHKNNLVLKHRHSSFDSNQPTETTTTTTTLSNYTKKKERIKLTYYFIRVNYSINWVLLEANMKTAEVTCIDYNDLLAISSSDTAATTTTDNPLLTKIGQGFGNNSDSLGIIIVSNIPSFKDIRSKLLHLSHELATCTPKEILDSLTIASANYQVGWSHGQEKVEGDDKFDTAKGSYYANPLSDHVLDYVLQRDFPQMDESQENDDNELMRRKEQYIRVAKENPAFYASNVWPESLPELEHSFKEMGLLIHSVGKMIASLCDVYVKNQCEEYESGKMEGIITNSMCCKGRLLHYFPMDKEKETFIPEETDENADGVDNILGDILFSNWCGWHNDHCSLTGLVPAMYIDSESGTEIQIPDPKAGLYIKSRKGECVQVKIPTDCLAFQIGETAQIHTGGLLQATPHAVRGCSQEGVSREAFAVFMEPE